MKTTYLLLLFPFYIFSQSQIGNDINGESTLDESGHAISLSSDGSIIAISAKLNNGNGSDSGHVRVFQNQSDSWVQLGQDIDGESILDQSGDSVALSSNGFIVAIGSPDNDGNGSQSGSARIFEYNGVDTWVQLGQDIDGFTSNDEFGDSISLSADGTIVAIGSSLHSSGRGHVRIFEYNGVDTWIQVGSDIDVSGIDGSGSSIELSNDGSRVVVNATRFNSNRGAVRVYENQSNNWVQIGQTISGEASSDQSGFSVSMAGNGNVIAIGAPFNNGNGNDSGHIRVFEYNGVDTWIQVGDDIDGESSTDRFGGAVALNFDGSVLIGGAILAEESTNTTANGDIRIFQNQSGSWVKIGNDIEGINPGDNFGFSVSISDSGNIIAGGSILNDNGGSNSGHVRIFNIGETLSINDVSLIKTISLFPNPISDVLNINIQSSITLKQINIYNNLGQQIITTKEKNINTKELGIGVYFLEIITNKGKTIRKFIKE